MIAHSLQAWATALGMERRTLEARMVKDGYNPPKKKGYKIPAMKVYVTMMGDEQAEKIRNLKADADRKARRGSPPGPVPSCAWFMTSPRVIGLHPILTRGRGDYCPGNGQNRPNGHNGGMPAAGL